MFSAWIFFKTREASTCWDVIADESGPHGEGDNSYVIDTFPAQRVQLLLRWPKPYEEFPT